MDGAQTLKPEIEAQLVELTSAEPRRGRVKAPAWSSAIPEQLNYDDPLELAATLGPRALAVALQQILLAPGLKPTTRAAMVANLCAQLASSVPKRRLWEAEKAIRGEAASLQQTTSGPIAETNPLKHAARTQTDPTTGRAKAIRGRPRKRALL